MQLRSALTQYIAYESSSPPWPISPHGPFQKPMTVGKACCAPMSLCLGGHVFGDFVKWATHSGLNPSLKLGKIQKYAMRFKIFIDKGTDEGMFSYNTVVVTLGA